MAELEALLVNAPRVGTSIDTYNSAQVLYSGEPMGPPDIGPMPGIGPGVGGYINDLPLIERFRYDESHGNPHLNYDIIIDTGLQRKPHLQRHTTIFDLD